MKKKKGVGNLLSCILSVVLLMAVVCFEINICSQLNLVVKKSRIERSFLMQMETEGYLSSSARDELLRQLTDMGVTGISLSGTTMTPAGYGSYVTLSVSGRIKLKNIIGMSGFFTWIYGDSTSEFKIYAKSTAKH